MSFLLLTVMMLQPLSFEQWERICDARAETCATESACSEDGICHSMLIVLPRHCHKPAPVFWVQDFWAMVEGQALTLGLTCSGMIVWERKATE